MDINSPIISFSPLEIQYFTEKFGEKNPGLVVCNSAGLRTLEGMFDVAISSSLMSSDCLTESLITISRHLGFSGFPTSMDLQPCLMSLEMHYNLSRAVSKRGVLGLYAVYELGDCPVYWTMTLYKAGYQIHRNKNVLILTTPCASVLCRPEVFDYMLYTTWQVLAANAFADSCPAFKAVFEPYDQCISNLPALNQRTAASKVLTAGATALIDRCWEYLPLDEEDTHSAYDQLGELVGSLKEMGIAMTPKSLHKMLKGNLEGLMTCSGNGNYAGVFRALRNIQTSPVYNGTYALHLEKYKSVAETSEKDTIDKYCNKTKYTPQIDDDMLCRMEAYLKKAIFQAGSKSKAANDILEFDADVVGERGTCQSILSILQDYSHKFVSLPHSRLLRRVRVKNCIEPEFTEEAVAYVNDTGMLRDLNNLKDMVLGGRSKEVYERLFEDFVTVGDRDMSHISDKAKLVNEEIEKLLEDGGNDLIGYELLTKEELVSHDWVMRRFLFCAMNIKEKELKAFFGRFFGTGTCSLKDTSTFMQRIYKTVLRIFPEDTMTMRGDKKHARIATNGAKLNDAQGLRSVLIDIESHNQSMNAQLTTPFWHICLDAVSGYERDDYKSLPSVFNVLTVFYHMDSAVPDDYAGRPAPYFVSTGQAGGIEGWHAFGWAIITIVALRVAMGIERVTEQVEELSCYNDDISMLVKELLRNPRLVPNLLKALDQHLRKVGLKLKPSQTQVSNCRYALVKIIFVEGRLSENVFKNLLRFSLTSSRTVFDPREAAEDLKNSLIAYLMHSKNHTPGYAVYTALSVLLLFFDFLCHSHALPLTAVNAKVVGTGRRTFQPYAELMFCCDRVLRNISNGKSYGEGSGKPSEFMQKCASDIRNNYRKDLGDLLQEDKTKVVMRYRYFSYGPIGGLAFEKPSHLTALGFGGSHVRYLWNLKPFADGLNCVSLDMALMAYDPAIMATMGLAPRDEIDELVANREALVRSEFISYLGATSKASLVLRRVKSWIRYKYNPVAPTNLGVFLDSLNEKQDACEHIVDLLNGQFHYRLANFFYTQTKACQMNLVLAKISESWSLVRSVLSYGEQNKLKRVINRSVMDTWARINTLYDRTQVPGYQGYMCYSPTITLQSLRLGYGVTHVDRPEPHVFEIVDPVPTEGENIGVREGIYIYADSMKRVARDSHQEAQEVHVKVEKANRVRDLSREEAALKKVRITLSWLIRNDPQLMNHAYLSRSTALALAKVVYRTWGQEGSVDLVLNTPGELVLGGQIAHRISASGRKAFVRSLLELNLDRSVRFVVTSMYYTILSGYDNNLNWGFFLFFLMGYTRMEFPSMKKAFYTLRPWAESVTYDVRNVELGTVSDSLSSKTADALGDLHFEVSTYRADYVQLEEHSRAARLLKTTGALPATLMTRLHCRMSRDYTSEESFDFPRRAYRALLGRLPQMIETGAESKIFASRFLDACMSNRVVVPVYRAEEGGELAIDEGMAGRMFASLRHLDTRDLMSYLDMVEVYATMDFILASSLSVTWVNLPDINQVYIGQAEEITEIQEPTIPSHYAYDVRELIIDPRFKIVEAYRRNECLSALLYRGKNRISRSHSGAAVPYGMLIRALEFGVIIKPANDGEATAGLLNLTGGRGDFQRMADAHVDRCSLRGSHSIWDVRSILRSDPYADPSCAVGERTMVMPEFDVATTEPEMVWGMTQPGQTTSMLFIEYSFLVGDQTALADNIMRYIFHIPTLAPEVKGYVLIRIGAKFMTLWGKLAVETSRPVGPGEPKMSVYLICDWDFLVDPYMYVLVCYETADVPASRYDSANVANLDKDARGQAIRLGEFMQSSSELEPYAKMREVLPPGIPQQLLDEVRHCREAQVDILPTASKKNIIVCFWARHIKDHEETKVVTKTSQGSHLRQLDILKTGLNLSWRTVSMVSRYASTGVDYHEDDYNDIEEVVNTILQEGIPRAAPQLQAIADLGNGLRAPAPTDSVDFVAILTSIVQDNHSLELSDADFLGQLFSSWNMAEDHDLLGEEDSEQEPVSDDDRGQWDGF